MELLRLNPRAGCLIFRGVPEHLLDVSTRHSIHSLREEWREDVNGFHVRLNTAPLFLFPAQIDSFDCSRNLIEAGSLYSDPDMNFIADDEKNLSQEKEDKHRSVNLSSRQADSPFSSPGHVQHCLYEAADFPPTAPSSEVLLSTGCSHLRHYESRHRICP